MKTLAIHLPSLRKIICGSDKIPADFEFEGVVECVSRCWQRDLSAWQSAGRFVVKCVRSVPSPEINRFTGKPFKSSKHRVFVKCGTCGGWIPAGRWHQHSPACESHAAAAAEFAKCIECGKPQGVHGDSDACVNPDCEAGKRQRAAITKSMLEM